MSGGAGLAAYDASLAGRLAPLTTLANQSLSNLMLPDGWALLYQYSASSAYGGAQYFLAAYPASAPTVCVLVLGAPWSRFISFYVPFVNHVLDPVSSAIVGNATSISADIGFSSMYKAVRKQLWLDIASVRQTVPAFAVNLPMITTGIGPGAAMAQLAALDLRPGKQNSPSEVAQLQSYAYSCPPFGDAAFAQFFAAQISNGYRLQAQADFFPTRPAPDSGYVQAGAAQSLPLKIPTYDAPWVERDGPYYQQLLTGAEPAADNAGSLDMSSGIDAMLAFSLSKLSAVAYQMAQHPGSTVAFGYDPYMLKSNVTLQGSVWASVFEGPDTLVIALRGTINWQELFTLVSDAFPATPDWLASGHGQYAKGLVALYGAGRDDLRAALSGLGNKPVLLTGHDIGGALANLMAVDLSQNPLPGQRRVAAVYTFGTPPAASNPFAASYDTGPLGAINYQVVRPNDVMPRMPLSGMLFTPGTRVALSGGEFDSYNGSTWHGLYNYINLLNPHV